MAELVYALALGASSRNGLGVRVPPNALFATVAQLVEHAICNRAVIGSIPIRGSDAPLAQLAEHVTLNHQVEGSIPSGCIT